MGDAFYVAMQIADGGPTKLTLLRVEADGTPTTVFDAMPGGELAVPTLVTGAGDLRVIYLARVNNQFGAWWRKFGLDGQPLSPPAPVTDDAGSFSGLALGADTLLVIGNNTASFSNAFSVGRLGADGTAVVPLFDVVQRPGDGFPWQTAILRGPDVVLAWAADGGPIRIARTTP